jgi:CheY-like chemotaxis protein
MSAKLGRVVEILLIEDNDGDIGLVKEVFKEGKIRNNLHVTYDGEEAMEFLRRQGKFKDAPHPDIILLDLNLPKKDGREVLADIKSDNNLKTIPVIVLTTSNANEDIIKMYDLDANSYIIKPVDFDQFLKVIRTIEDFWLEVVKLPLNGC